MNLFDVIKDALSKRPRKPIKGEIVDIYGRPVKDALEYFYPKQITGIPVFSVDSIYEHYKEMVKEVKKNSGIGEHREDEGIKKLDYLFTHVIKRYIEYVHMLPASENHHHSTPGGMIVHSLEASAHAQKFAKEHKPESMGMQDLDRKSLPVYRYAAWLATFLHDAGKVLRDIVVDAVDIEYKGKNVRVTNSNAIPSWRPQKESLVDWAKRFNVATYSVTYIKDRIHNQHNVDSVQLLSPVLGTGKALEFLLDCPADVHSKLVRVLAGHDNGKDYIASSVRRGDMLSTSRNVALSVGNTYLTEQSLSAPAKIYKAMKIAKKDWSYNTMNADVWVIGGEVYLRYTKAFHSIIKTANKNDLTIPNDLSVVTMLMEESGITEPFDPKHKSVKFVQGQFSDKQLEGMLNGKEVVTWMELVKIKWKGLLFSDEPMPDSEIGVFYMVENKELIEVNGIGEFKPFVPNLNTDAQLPDNTNHSNNDFAPPQGELPPLPTEEEMQGHIQVNEKPKTSQLKPNAKKIIEDAKSAPKKPKPKLNFKNKPTDNQETLIVDSAPEQEKQKGQTAKAKLTSNKPKSQAESQKPTEPKLPAKPEQVKPTEAVKNVTQVKHVEQEPKAQPEPKEKNAVGDDSSLVVISEITKHVKLVTTKQKKGAYVCVDDAMKYLKIDDKMKVMKVLVESGVARLESGSPIVFLETVNGKKQQIIEVNVTSIKPSPAKTQKASAEGNPTNDSPQGEDDTHKKEPRRKRNKKPNNQPEQNPVEETAIKSELAEVIKSAQDSKEEATDYGLLMRVSQSRPNTLASYIKQIIESYPDNSDKRDFIIERQGKIAINATKIIEQVKTKNPDAVFQLRHLLKSCKAAGAETERVQIDGVNYVELRSDVIQEIDIEV
jgi:hypothetical protein